MFEWHSPEEKKRFLCWSMVQQFRTILCLHLVESSLESHQQQSNFGLGKKKFKGKSCFFRAEGSRPLATAEEKVDRVRVTNSCKSFYGIHVEFLTQI